MTVGSWKQRRKARCTDSEGKLCKDLGDWTETAPLVIGHTKQSSRMSQS